MTGLPLNLDWQQILLHLLPVKHVFTEKLGRTLGGFGNFYRVFLEGFAHYGESDGGRHIFSLLIIDA